MSADSADSVPNWRCSVRQAFCFSGMMRGDPVSVRRPEEVGKLKRRRPASAEPRAPKAATEPALRSCRRRRVER